jgi:DNA replication protein DnaC
MLYNDTELKEFEREINCELHGTQIEKGHKWGKNDPVWYGCPICIDIEHQELEEEEKKREQAEEEQKRKLSIAKKLNNAQIPLRYVDTKLNNFVVDNDQQKIKKDFCKNYIDDFENGLNLGRSMVFCGTTGTGKTLLSCCILGEIIKKYNKTGLFITTIKAVRTVKSTYSKESTTTEQEAIDNLVRYDLLVLDEVGVQFGTEAEKIILFEIINERYQNKKPTILISNLAIDNLRDFVGDRIIDRMAENGGGVLIFNWKSKRTN